MADPKPTTMSENAREAAKLIALDQQKRAGRKVRVIATADGFDGFRFRTEGERFIAWWPNEIEKEVTEGAKLVKKMVPCRPPSWQLEEEKYDKQQRALKQSERETADVGE